MNKTNRLGATKTMENGLIATIIAYRRSDDIDVQFEDGTIVEHKTYANFSKGYIGNPNFVQLSKIRQGERKTMENGQIATIIAYRGNTDIDVQFEDGTIVEHKSYFYFSNGCIRNPNFIQPNTRLGESRTMNNGQKATIIAYRSAHDIDIQFEDGTINEHKLYSSFLKGEIRNPNFIQPNTRLGETRTMKNGQKATIIEYREYMDIDVRFEDGTIVEHRTYLSFLNGVIKNLNLIQTTRLGETRTMNKGQKATIIAYRSAQDIDIQFEDSTIVEHRTYASFSNGCIKNPHLNRSTTEYKDFKIHYAFRKDEDAYYNVHCEICGLDEIWTPQQMAEHRKLCNTKNT